MAGIKILEKNLVNISYVVHRLSAPELHRKLFDDRWGSDYTEAILASERTIIYGLFEKGRPEPMGVVWFSEIIPYRGCTLSAAVFEPENRHQHKLTPLMPIIQKDFLSKVPVKNCSTFVILPNDDSVAVLLKLDFKLVGVREKYVSSGGEYKDQAIYYRILGG